MSDIDRFDCSTNLQTKSTSSENSVSMGSWHVALKKCRIPLKKGIRVGKKLCFNVFMSFLHALYERTHYDCFLRNAPFKTALCLAYRDYETSLLTSSIMKLKIDAYRTFIKVLSEKSYQFLLS